MYSQRTSSGRSYHFQIKIPNQVMNGPITMKSSKEKQIESDEKNKAVNYNIISPNQIRLR